MLFRSEILSFERPIICLIIDATSVTVRYFRDPRISEKLLLYNLGRIRIKNC